jgi:hypothetical protein
MAEPFAVLRVESEEDAWTLLERALTEAVPPDLIPIINFEGWPKLTVDLPRTPIDGSISPSMMEAFIELQRTIYRTHTFLTADTGDLRTLSRAEKEDLEFRVKVENGSSHYDVDLQAILEKLTTEALGKMDSTHIVITALGLALIYASVQVLKHWIDAKAEQRKQELSDEERKQWLEHHQITIAHDTKRFELLLDAMKRQPLLSEVEASADAARQQMLKAISDERGGSISGVDIDADFANEIVSQRRQQGEDIRLSGVYRVSKVDTTSPEGFRVTLSDIKTGQDVTAAMLDVLLSEEQRKVIQDAEWHKRPVFVEMKARKLRNRVVDAVVLNAREAALAETNGRRGS